ncbi:hypothetical protein F4859DRAFT_517439 [Xylaria cf. heliscus]|nr:hypothetical protein F4859DRAFT_517439 [Xylaria cf. heliscus]
MDVQLVHSNEGYDEEVPHPEPQEDGAGNHTMWLERDDSWHSPILGILSGSEFDIINTLARTGIFASYRVFGTFSGNMFRYCLERPVVTPPTSVNSSSTRFEVILDERTRTLTFDRCRPLLVDGLYVGPQCDRMNAVCYNPIVTSLMPRQFVFPEDPVFVSDAVMRRMLAIHMAVNAMELPPANIPTDPVSVVDFLCAYIYTRLKAPHPILSGRSMVVTLTMNRFAEIEPMLEFTEGDTGSDPQDRLVLRAMALLLYS